MSEHTPGPWTIARIDTSRVMFRGEYRVQAPSGEVPALAMTECDARLIAAAPDLLAFAQEFVRVWAGPGATDSPLEAQARAAIAKAEGNHEPS